MQIIIIGAGKVGSNVAEDLSQEADNDITIIDKNPRVLSKTIEGLDVSSIKGNGARASVLIDAGVREADLVVAATSSDELNMVCCLTAKKLGAKHTIARIRDPEYADELSQIKADLDLDMIINPEEALASEIAKLLEFPAVTDMESFAKGLVEMVAFNVEANMPIAEKAVKDLAKYTKTRFLLAAIRRGDDLIIPSGETIVHADDKVYLIGHPARIFRFCTQIGMHTQKTKDAMIIGGGRISYYLGRYLLDIDIKVKIIELNHSRCLELSDLLPGALIINGDGTDDSLLISENLKEMEAFIAVTGMDEENIMSSLYAKRNGVSKVIAKVNRTAYIDLMTGSFAIDNLVSPKPVMANLIIRYVRGIMNAKGQYINSLYRILDDRAELIEFTADVNCRLLDMPFKTLNFKRGILICTLVRKNVIIIPGGDDRIKLNDTVVLISKGHNINSLDDTLEVEAAL